jgi:hypothetical protein
MGWQDRDWAKLRDDELDQLYGMRRPPEGGRTISPRKIVWGALVVLVLAVGGFAFTQLPHAPAPVYGKLPGEPDVIYGNPAQLSGELGVCTEYVVDRAGAWQCTVIDLNTRHLRVARAQTFEGTCAHLIADQPTGRWLCVSDRPAEAPAAPAGHSS